MTTQTKAKQLAENAYLLLISRLAAPLVAVLAAFIWVSFMQEYRQHEREVNARWEVSQEADKRHEVDLTVIKATRFTPSDADNRDARMEVRIAEQINPLKEDINNMKRDLRTIRDAILQVKKQ